MRVYVTLKIAIAKKKRLSRFYCLVIAMDSNTAKATGATNQPPHKRQPNSSGFAEHLAAELPDHAV